MRFGLCTGDVEVIRQLPALGYDYADVGGRTVIPFESEAAFAAVKARLRDTDVPIEGMGGFIPESVRIVGPEVDWARVRGYLETTIGRAAALGVKAINWGSAPSKHVPPGWPMSRAWAQIERAGDLIAALAEAAGVVVVIEPINPRETNILYYTVEGLNLAQTVNRPGLRLLVDYYHVMKQDEPLEQVKAAAGWIAHAHTSDDERAFPCLGQWDQRPFLRTLREMGYDGRLSFEVRRHDDAGYAESARTSVQRMRALYQQVYGA
ncbi:MAG: sugar phosphate isomerase/epimerase family protein [Chloroflexota bacterium]